MPIQPFNTLSTVIDRATDLARGVRHSFFGCSCFCSLPDEILLIIFRLVEEFTRDEWNQTLETEQEIIYLGLHLSHVCRKWRRVALGVPSLWSGIHISQYELPQAPSSTLSNSIRHFVHYSSTMFLNITVPAGTHHILASLPTQRVRSLAIYGTLDAIYDASMQWGTHFPVLEDLILQVSPLPPPIQGFERETPIVEESFFDFFPAMTWLTLQNVDHIPRHRRASALRRLTWSIDPQCELVSLSFSHFHDLTDVRYLELDMPNLSGDVFRIAESLEEMVFKNASATIINTLVVTPAPNLTSLTITSAENITFGLVEFLKDTQGERIRALSLSLVDISSTEWYFILYRVPNVERLELGLTPTVALPYPLMELMDALTMHLTHTIIVPKLSELRLAGDVLAGIVRVADFLRVRSMESHITGKQRVAAVNALVLPIGYFTRIPEPLAWELESFAVVSADAALNYLAEPIF